MIAFDYCRVFKNNTSKFSCIEAWGKDGLIVGTTDGTLLKYSVKQSPSLKPDSPANQFSAVCDAPPTQPHKNKAILKITALERLGVLVVLPSDGPITIHDLSFNFPQRTVLSKTKGCLFYSLSDTGSPSETATRATDVYMCVAIKKKIMLFQWDGKKANTFVELRELSVPDTPKSIVWADSNMLVGFAREYMFVNSVNGATKEVFSMSGARNNVFAMRSADNNLLTLRAKTTVFFTLDGSPTRHHGIQWTEQPFCFVCAPPFIIGAIAEMHVEVRMLIANEDRNTQQKDFLQVIPIKGAKGISFKTVANGNNYVCYIATADSLYRIIPKPLTEVIDGLVRDQEFSLALPLCDSLSPDDPLNADKIHSVRVNYASYLFSKGQFRESLDLFQGLGTSPLDIIALYDDLLPTQCRTITKIPRLDMRDVMAVQVTKVTAYKALLVYLLQKRSEVCTPDALAISQECTLQEIEADYNMCTTVPTIIDTTILKVCLFLHDDHLLGLCTSPNCCHVNEASSTLRKAKCDKELVLFYYSKGLHASALEVLSSSEQLSETVHIVEYLRKLGASCKELVFSHAKRLFKIDAGLALTIFTQNVNVGTDNELPRMEVLDFLKAVCEKKVISYLEFLISRGETSTLFHDELASQYIETITALYDAFGGFPKTKPYPEPGKEPGDLGQYRKAFLHFLETSQYYRPEVLVAGNKMPISGLFEERAAIMSRLGNHKSVLAIYALDLDNSAKAEEYCRKHVDEDDETRKELYFHLLEVYLKPPESVPGGPPRPTEPMLEPALKLLNEHYQRINISQALDLLPPSTKLSALMPFFTRVLSETARQRRDSQIVRALLRSEGLRVREDYIAARSPYVYVDDNTLCSKCHRPLRTSAFVRDPDTGQIMHMVCHQKSEAAAASAAAQAASENVVDVDQQVFEDYMDGADFGATTGAAASLFASSPTPQSTNPFGDSAPGAGAPSMPILSSNPFIEDYNPAAAGGSSPGIAPQSTNPFAAPQSTNPFAAPQSTNPFADDYGGGFM